MAIEGLDGQAYIVDIIHLQKIQLKAKPTDFASVADIAIMNKTEYVEYKDFMAIDEGNNKPWASVN